MMKSVRTFSEPKSPGEVLRQRRASAPADEPYTAISPHENKKDSLDRESRAERPCVLVVDDHHDTRRAYADELRSSGFRTAEAENGVIALKMAHELHPDAILLDYAMPMMDGLQAALCLKRDPRTAQIPVVMITAFRDHVGERQQRCDDVLDKPCDPRDVVAKIWDVVWATAPRAKAAASAGSTRRFFFGRSRS